MKKKILGLLVMVACFFGMSSVNATIINTETGDQIYFTYATSRQYNGQEYKIWVYPGMWCDSSQGIEDPNSDESLNFKFDSDGYLEQFTNMNTEFYGNSMSGLGLMDALFWEYIEKQYTPMYKE